MGANQFTKNMYLDRRTLVNGLTPTTINLENFVNIGEYIQWLIDNNYITIGPEDTAACTKEVTYAELIALIGTSSLEPFCYYVLTDYQTIYDQPDFEDDIFGNIQSKVILETKTGAIMPLVLTAASSNTLNPEGFVLNSPEIKVIYYALDIDTGIPPTTPVMGVTTKGTIYRMTDTFYNVDCYYDYLNILYKRYYNNSAPFGDDRDYMFIKDNGENFIEFLTFNYDLGYGDVHINISFPVDYNPTGLPNNVFQHEAFGVNFEIQSIQNTFLNKVISFHSTAGFVNNLFFGEVNDTYFGHISTQNVFQGNLLATQFLSLSHGNIFQDDVEANIFYGACGGTDKNNLFMGIVKNNTFKGDVFTNNFLYSVEGNCFDSHVIENCFMCALTFNHFNSLVAYNTWRFEVQEINITDILTYELSFSFNNITGLTTNNWLYGEPAPVSEDEEVTPTYGLFHHNNIGIFTDNGTELNNCYIYDFIYNNIKIFSGNQFGGDMTGGMLSTEGVSCVINNIEVFANNIINKIRIYYNNISNFSSNVISGDVTTSGSDSSEDIIIQCKGQSFSSNILDNTPLSVIEFDSFNSNELTDTIVEDCYFYEFNNNFYNSTSILKTNYRNGRGFTYLKYVFAGNSLLSGTSALKGWIPVGAIPTKIVVIPDSVTGNALAEIEVGIETDDETYGLPATDITTLTNTVVNTLSTTTTGSRQIKITASVEDITGGAIEVFVEYIKTN